MKKKKYWAVMVETHLTSREAQPSLLIEMVIIRCGRCGYC